MIDEADIASALAILRSAFDATHDSESHAAADAYCARFLHTMNRLERQHAISELVRERALSTQAEVASALREAGFEVVQTTVSRDIADLGLVKVRAPSGRLVYASPGTSDGDRMRALGAAIRRYAMGAEAAGTLVVLTTPSGYASALAQAIDEAAHPGVAGTVAGDNVIFVAARDGISAAALRDDLSGHLLQGAA